LPERITAIHDESRRTHGSAKVYQKLRRDGARVNHKRDERLMREHELRAKRVKKFRQTTTDSHHSLAVAENVLGRNFSVARPDEVWTTDITDIWTDEGWLYLCGVS
jgi:putative transposase